MKKIFAITCAALAASVMAAPANASVTITCETSTGPQFSSCDTSASPLPEGSWIASSTSSVDDQGVDFYFRTTSAQNPLATIDFSDGGALLTMEVFDLRAISRTVLTFTSSKPFFGVVSTSGILSGLGSVNNQNQFVLDLSGETLDVGTGSIALSVPEPGTWLLMILGLGAVGFSMRRRQKATVRYQFA
jgi:hypothetical protein